MKAFIKFFVFAAVFTAVSSVSFAAENQTGEPCNKAATGKDKAEKPGTVPGQTQQTAPDTSTAQPSK